MEYNNLLRDASTGFVITPNQRSEMRKYIPVSLPVEPVKKELKIMPVSK